MNIHIEELIQQSTEAKLNHGESEVTSARIDNLEEKLKSSVDEVSRGLIKTNM